MQTTANTTTLVPGDASALGELARVQGNVGAMPLTKAGLTDFMAGLNVWPRPGAPASWSQVINQTGLAAEGAQ